MNWKKLLGLRNMQEKLEKEFCFLVRIYRQCLVFLGLNEKFAVQVRSNVVDKNLMEEKNSNPTFFSVHINFTCTAKYTIIGLLST